MKKLLIILVTMLPLVVNADPVEIDGIWYNLIIKGKVAEVTQNPENISYTTDVIDIPSSVQYDGVTYSVTSIGSFAFSDCKNLISINLPNSIKDIESCAFSGCKNLPYISIPSSVTSIGKRAFYDCSLTFVNISDIEAWCKIQFDDISSNPLYYARHLYLNGEEIKVLNIPNSVSTIGNYVFSGHTNLTSVNLPNNVTSIGICAFEGCTSLTSINIPSSVKIIEAGTFLACI